VRECAGDQPIRVIITDRDFDANIDQDPTNPGVVAAAAAASPRLVLLLHAPKSERIVMYRELGASVIPVETLDDFPRLAAELTRALFPDTNHGAL
jgi:hypothetical protein